MLQRASKAPGAGLTPAGSDSLDTPRSQDSGVGLQLSPQRAEGQAGALMPAGGDGQASRLSPAQSGWLHVGPAC